MSEKYVPQVGDYVWGRRVKRTRAGGMVTDSDVVNGLYAGAIPSASGTHAIAWLPSGETAEVSQVGRPDSYWGSPSDTIGGGLSVLFEFCESLAERPLATAQAVGYRDVAAMRAAMPADMLAWWEKYRGEMLIRRFTETTYEMSKATQSIDVIRSNDGEPSVALQERLDAATFRLDALRAKLRAFYATEIDLARTAFGIHPLEGA